MLPTFWMEPATQKPTDNPELLQWWWIKLALVAVTATSGAQHRLHGAISAMKGFFGEKKTELSLKMSSSYCHSFAFIVCPPPLPPNSILILWIWFWLMLNFNQMQGFVAFSCSSRRSDCNWDPCSVSFPYHILYLFT